MKKSLIPFGNPLKIRRKNILKKGKFGFRSMTKFLTYFALAVLLFVAILFAWFSKDLPTPGKIARRTAAQSTKIFDRNGNLLYETGEQKRTSVEPDQISDYLKKATIAIEDKDFYNHHGVDLRGFFRAVYNNIFKKQSVQGGSTITQQYVKNALLTGEKTYTRKIKELILSIEIEQMYSKDQILVMYLNEIPYGSNVAGAEAASQMYYGIPAKDLSPVQAATLAAIPQASTYYSPYGIHTADLIYRRNYILDRMVKFDYLAKDEAEAQKKIDTTTVNINYDNDKIGVRPRKDSIKAPHFSLYLLDLLAEKFGEEKINKEGLNVISSLDFEKQEIAEKAVTEGAAKNKTKYNANNASLVSIDPKTGQVLAMVGSKDFFDSSIDGNVNVAISKRQPGSSFKPIVYATAFKKPENSPSRILFDLTTDFGGNYVPKNYNGRVNGPVSMRFALSNSLNIPAVKTLALAGIDESLKTANDLGITTLNKSEDYYGLSLVLGTGEVKLLELTGAYSVFANGGIKHDINTILKVEDNSGKLLYQYEENKDKGKEALDPEIAYEISSILSDNKTRSAIFGANSPLYFPNRTVAAKTGTTSDFKDGWTLGFTPSIATGVWVGNNDSKPMSQGEALYSAAPIFHQYMEEVLKNSENQEFSRPNGIVDVTVDKFSNKLPSEASPELITDIFASWQVPKEQDNVHIKVRVCKANGLLAGDEIPDSLIEERIYTNLHSEFPDKPNWENPVRSWLQSVGLDNLPPTENCDSTSLIPLISIKNPTNDQTVSGNIEITAEASSGAGIANVEFFIDNISIGKDADSPFTITYNTSSLSAGKHTLAAIITDNNGTTAKNEISINVQKITALFSSVVAQNTSSGKVTVNWKTDISTASEITYGISSNNYTLNKKDDLLTKDHSLVIDVNPSTKYYYTVSGKDSSGNNSYSNEYSFTSGI
jgi:penicillin-binding protein 1C